MFAPKVAKPQQKATTYSLANRRSPFPAHPFGQSAGEHSLFPERPTGNEAVKLQEAGPEGVAARAEPGGASWNFCLVPLLPPGQPNRRLPFSSLAPFPMPAPLQPKLAVGRIDDPLEREADAVAEQVMRMPAPARLSRKCTECEAGEEKEELQRRQARPTGPVASEAPPIVHEVLRSSGQPLDAATRAFFEPRFAHDFSRVRVHTGAAAEQSARDVNAKAYTVRHNIVFGTGRFAPGTHEGQKLLAHELTHVVQQQGTDRSSLSAEWEIPDDQLQRQDDGTDDAVAGGDQTNGAAFVPAPAPPVTPPSPPPPAPTPIQVISGDGPTQEAACDAAKQNCESTCGILPAQIGTCECYASGYPDEPGFTCNVTCECAGQAGRWSCDASCNVEGTEPQCTGRVTGHSSGNSSEEEACREAKRDATQKAPRGCYARHCRCFNCTNR
jgi:Domain of unknown function (DUF4157)